jgi:hypothetical protein
MCPLGNMCAGRIERRHRRSPYQAPPLKRPRLVAVYSGPRPIAVETQIFAVVMREASRLKRLECSTRRQSSTRVREFREWKRTKASLLCSEHDAHLITGDVAMLTSMKLGLATTVAALSIAAVTSAGAAVNPTSAGEIVDQLAVREQSRTPGARQCWITADDNDHGNFGYWGSCSSPRASAAPASPTFQMQAQARRKCEEDLGYGRTGLFGCGG